MSDCAAEVRLGDVAAFASGGTPSKSEPAFWDGDIPWISGASMTGPRLSRSDRNVTGEAIGNGTKIAPTGSTLILVRGMSLHNEIRIGRAVRDVAFNQDVKALTSKGGIQPEFLTYALEGRHDELLGLVHAAGHGTGVLATDRLQDLRLWLPPIEVQRRIVGVLTAMDDLIEHNGLLAASAEELAQNLTKTASKFATLGSLSRPRRVKQARPQGLVSHYSLPAFDEGAMPEIVPGESIKSAKYPFNQPTVLVSRLNPQWQRCWMAYPTENSVASTEFVLLDPIEAAIEEVWAVASDDAFWEQMRALVTGTTGSHQRVDKTALLTLSVPDVRALALVTRSAVRRLVSAAASLRSEVEDLRRTREALLPLLISGRMRVNDVSELRF